MAPGPRLPQAKRCSFGDRIRRPVEDSRAVVRMADGSVLQLDEFTTIEIKPPKGGASAATLNVPSGGAFFFNRAGSRRVPIETPSANGAIRGTAFLLTVSQPDGRTIAGDDRRRVSAFEQRQR